MIHVVKNQKPYVFFRFISPSLYEISTPKGRLAIFQKAIKWSIGNIKGNLGFEGNKCLFMCFWTYIFCSAVGNVFHTENKNIFMLLLSEIYFIKEKKSRSHAENRRVIDFYLLRKSHQIWFAFCYNAKHEVGGGRKCKCSRYRVSKNN